MLRGRRSIASRLNTTEQVYPCGCCVSHTEERRGEGWGGRSRGGRDGGRLPGAGHHGQGNGDQPPPPRLPRHRLEPDHRQGIYLSTGSAAARFNPGSVVPSSSLIRLSRAVLLVPRARRARRHRRGDARRRRRQVQIHHRHALRPQRRPIRKRTIRGTSVALLKRNLSLSF